MKKKYIVPKILVVSCLIETNVLSGSPANGENYSYGDDEQNKKNTVNPPGYNKPTETGAKGSSFWDDEW